MTKPDARRERDKNMAIIEPLSEEVMEEAARRRANPGKNGNFMNKSENERARDIIIVATKLLQLYLHILPDIPRRRADIAASIPRRGGFIISLSAPKNIRIE